MGRSRILISTNDGNLVLGGADAARTGGTGLFRRNQERACRRGYVQPDLIILVYDGHATARFQLAQKLHGAGLTPGKSHPI